MQDLEEGVVGYAHFDLFLLVLSLLLDVMQLLLYLNLELHDEQVIDFYLFILRQLLMTVVILNL